jgi:hypothetical protein
MFIGLSRDDVQSVRSARREGMIVGLCYGKRARDYTTRIQTIEVLIQVVTCRATLSRFYAE